MSTKTKRKESVVLATDKDGREIFVKFRATGISPLVAMVDGLPMTFFGNGKTPYVRVRAALEWYEKELPHDPENKNYQTAITAFRRILERFANGEIQFS